MPSASTSIATVTVQAQLARSDHVQGGRANIRRYPNRMTRATLVFVLVIACSISASAKKPGKGKGREKGANPHTAATQSAVRWGAGDVRILREYYVQHPVNLPPGLQKRYERTGQLPPGWQKKLQAFPSGIESRLPPPCAYCGRGVVDGYGVIYDKRTNIILDSVRLVGDILR